jgi:protein-tyrosine phosphatase
MGQRRDTKECVLFDIHCHLLSGVDDGAQSMDEAVKMARMAWDDGVRDILVTPHVNHPQGFDGPADGVAGVRQFQALQEAVKSCCPGLRLHQGGENYVRRNGGTTQFKRFQPLAETKYLLVEFSREITLSQLQHAVDELQLAGWKPVLAHVEVYPCFVDGAADGVADGSADGAGMKAIAQLRADGVLIQCNAAHLVAGGSNGFVMRLLRKGFVDFIASDGHNLAQRKPLLSKAFKAVASRFGVQEATRLFVENPNALLAGELLSREPFGGARVSFLRNRLRSWQAVAAALTAALLLSGVVYVALAMGSDPVANVGTDPTTGKASAAEIPAPHDGGEAESLIAAADIAVSEGTVSAGVASEGTVSEGAASAGTASEGVDTRLHAKDEQTAEASFSEAVDEASPDAAGDSTAEATPASMGSDPVGGMGVDSESWQPSEAITGDPARDALVADYLDYLHGREQFYLAAVASAAEELRAVLEMAEGPEQEVAARAVLDALGQMEVQSDNDVYKTLYDFQNDLEDNNWDVGIIKACREHYLNMKADIAEQYREKLGGLTP